MPQLETEVIIRNGRVVGGGSSGVTDVQVNGNSVVSSGVAEIDLTGKADTATTLAGYGITDANINNGTITLGSNTITPLTSHQDISGKVNKSGDTMTGNLTINNAQVMVKENDITSGSNPSSDVWGKGFRINDSAGANIAHTRAIKYTSGKQGIQVEAQRAISGTNYFNSLNMLIDAAGTKTIEVSDAAAWRSAIGAVNKAGDTMSGNLTVSRSGEALIQTKNTQWTLTTASNNGITANTSAGAFYHLGSDNTMIGRTNCYGGSDGAVSIVLQVYNKKTNGSSVNNAISAIIKKDGSQTYSVSNATNFRSAINAAASSSRAYKENIEEMSEEEARKILDIEVCSYDYKEGFGEKEQFGVIAEDVLDKIPYAVNIPENYDEKNIKPEEGTTQELITIDYWKFIPHLIKTVQMQQREIEELKAEIEAIKEKH